MTAIRITSTAQLIAYTSHALGFTPHESLVVIPHGHRGPTARVDFPTTVEDVLAIADALGHAYTPSPDTTPGTTTGGEEARSVVLIAYTHHTTTAPLVLGALEAALGQVVHVEQCLAVTGEGEGWSVIAHGEVVATGTITQTERDKVAVQSVAAGIRQPDESRSSHVNRFQRATPIDAATLAHARREVDAQTPEAVAEAALAITATTRATGLMPDNVETARLITAADLPAVRETLTSTATSDTARVDLAMWTHVANRAPHTHQRGAALHLAAFCAWLAGDGALGWTALETAAAEGAAPDEVSARATAAFTDAIDPHTWPTE